MTKMQWEKSRTKSAQAREIRSSDVGKVGVRPCSDKQRRFLEVLSRKLGYPHLDRFTVQYRGESQTLSARQASYAINDALRRLGGKARQG